MRDDWIKKMWYIHKMEYYLALRKKEDPSYITTWTNLKDIILSGISWSQEGKSYLYEASKRVKLR